MRGFTPNTSFTSKRTYSHQEELEAKIKARFRPGAISHARLPWSMKRDGRNRTWIVDAQGVRVSLHSGNIKLILQALAAYKDEGE